MIVAAATSAIAWLLDPAIEKIFIEKDQKLILIIPLANNSSFFCKRNIFIFSKSYYDWCC